MTSEPLEESQGPVIRDKRRIDPETGEVRVPHDAAPSPASETDGSAAPSGEPPFDEATSALAAAEVALAERTADLQRLQAEYVNYKRRVDRDRQAVRDAAVVHVLTGLLPVLDDIERAREHGELEGGFKAVAESLERTVAGLGLETFGEVGDEFDPRVHEALMHSYSDEVSGPVAQAVLQVGYRLGERVIRPARVAVAEPSAAAQEAEPVESSADGAAETDSTIDVETSAAPTDDAIVDDKR